MRTSLLATVVMGAISLGALACISTSVSPITSRPNSPTADDLGTPDHRDEVMSSRFCADCHPAIYAEHRQNTHGRAFFDEEARLATRGFRRDDCIRCHTPRPVFETGIGMTPMQRWTDLEEGNTCMSCHGRAGYDYTRFVGGAECKGAFEPDVGTVTDCASCHRIAGTPDQWSRAEHGKLAGRVCIDCHMPLVDRPVAVGQPVRSVRSHVFPASSNESQLRRAYDYEANIDGNNVVVRITNKGVGHNFPTANRQRAVESLVVVRDYAGNEVARSRLVCRYPYASELAPHQLILPVSSQIPSGKSTQHRVPLTIANGTVECRLYFKLYRPSADSDAALSRCLEERRIPFKNITPSTEAVQPDMEVGFPAKGSSLDEFCSPSGLTNVVRPDDPTKAIVVPLGKTPNELKTLGAMLESHLPEVRKTARERLAQVYPASAEVLLAVLGRWSNESFNEAKATFLLIGPAAVPELLHALSSDELYVRYHARELLARLSQDSERPAVVAALWEALSVENPLDRRSAAQALGLLRDPGSAPLLRARLVDADWDVVHAAATSLAALGDHDCVPEMQSALRRARWPETHSALSVALASLGSSAGIQQLINDLDNEDELQRQYTFAALFSILGRHFGYEADAPASERKFAVSRLQAWWTEEGGDALVHAPQHVDPEIHARAWRLIEQLGGGTDTALGGDDVAIQDELLTLGDDAIPALIEGLTFPAGYVQKRSLCCQLLGRLGTHEAAPYLAAALRDPNSAVTDWACWALEHCGDADTLPQLRRYQDRISSLLGVERGAGANAPGDQLLARAARVRWVLGDGKAREDLVSLLSSRNETARKISIEALCERYGDDRGYDPDADAASRADSELRWREP